MRARAVFLAGAIGLALTAATQAAIIYVSTGAADVTYAQLGAGYNGQAGTIGNPFGSIQAAYHYLWTQGGDHEIRLLSGTYSGAKIGVNEFAHGDGYLRFVSGSGAAGTFPSTDPAWTSVTLTPNSGPGTVTLSMQDQMTGFQTAAYPAAFEKRVVNSNNNATRDRGNVIRGLWNAGTTHDLTGMIVENLDIIIGGGHVLIGTTAGDPPSLTGTQFTFNNVNITLQNNVIDNPVVTGDPWGRSALFVSHMDQTDMNNSWLSFNNSNIFLVNDDGTAWSGNFYVGQTWGPGGTGSWYKMPDNFVSGNNTSTLQFWDGSQYVLWDDTTPYSIWQSGRNSGNTLTAYQLGAEGVNNFFNLSSFGPEVIIPEPASLALLGLAGGALLLRRRRRA